MSEYKNADEARRGVWAYTFDEILEIVQLLQWANLQTTVEHSKQFPEATVVSAFGDRPVSQAVKHHMQQLLAVKIESVFGKRGSGSLENGKEISTNKQLGERWWRPMREFADTAVSNPQALHALLNRLEVDRHRMIAHREGRTADVTHEQNPNGRSIVFKANPDPVADDELENLRSYFKACKFFCEHAKNTENGPTLRYIDQMAWRNA